MWFTFNFRACFFSSCLSSAGVTPICRTESEYWSPWRPRRHRRPAHWACRPWRTQRPVCPTRPPGWDWDRPGRQRRMNETMTKDPPLLTGREYLFFLYFSSFFFYSDAAGEITWYWGELQNVFLRGGGFKRGTKTDCTANSLALKSK